jgi:hypothetical protein
MNPTPTKRPVPPARKQPAKKSTGNGSAAIIALGAFILGGLIAFPWSAGAAAPAARHDELLSPEKIEAEIARLEGENQTLNGTIAQAEALAAQQTAEQAGQPRTFTPREKLAILSDLMKQGLVGETMFMQMRNGSMDEAFAAAFDLTPAEKDALTQAFNDARGKIDAIGATKAVDTYDANGNLVINIPAFPTEGDQVKANFLATVAGILGPDRTDAFVSLTATKILPIGFLDFGGPRTVTLSRNPDPTSTNPYGVQDVKMNRAGQAISQAWAGGTTMEQLQNNYRIAQLLPPGY